MHFSLLIDTLEKYREKTSTFFENTTYFKSAHTSFLSYFLLKTQQDIGNPILIVTPTDDQAYAMAKDFRSFDSDIVVLPSWKIAIGTELAPYASIWAERASSLHTIAHTHPSIVLCSMRSFLQLVPNKEHILNRTHVIKTTQSIDIGSFIDKLVSFGYTRVSQVESFGEFAIRGEVIDICCDIRLKEAKGIRINSAYDVVEQIRHFSLTSQLSTDVITEEHIHPTAEFLWSNSELSHVYKDEMDGEKRYPNEQREKNAVSYLMRTIKKSFPELQSRILKDIVETIVHKEYEGRQYLYYPFLLQERMHITQYFDKAPILWYTHYEMYRREEQRFWDELERVFLELGRFYPIPRTTRLKEIVEEHCVYEKEVYIYETQKNKTSIEIPDRTNKHFASNMTFFIKHSKEVCRNRANTVFLCVQDEEGERMRQLCTKELVDLENFSVISSELSHGFSLIDEQKQTTLQVFTEIDIFGKRMIGGDTKSLKTIFSMDQIALGDYVVHILYGIGKFNGIIRRSIRGMQRDYIRIEYTKNEKLFVPVEQMNMVQRYIGQNAEQLTLDSLGSDVWQKRKKQVEKNIEDMSEELLEMYAKRSNAKGVCFSSIDWEESFLDDFSFDDTEDQAKAWEEIKIDMQKPIPMDRLLVGDVGFGKTEIAFRAAFRAVSNGSQVLMLVPTTILAEQHLETARERFKRFPIRIEMLSRFVSVKNQKKIIESIKKGEVEFLIGTHRSIQSDVHFTKLGLVIVDEEHRFGVKDKEKIKKLKYNVDCLSMSATPIPRTLYQSLVSLRDLSSLNTAPKQRKAIQTHIERFSENVVQKAIQQELKRDGQVFVLHNRIKTLDKMKQLIEILVPEATVLTASGKMQAIELEDTMYQFTHGAANVLVSTTIIENGIDIPRVNTIIIDRADYYGISQLYQLRGRVGRSDRQSYAYLLYPDDMHISELSLKRMSVIAENTELGSGFNIAMRDLEVRGAGNLLGKEQSGNIYSIGYEYYMQLLDKTIKRMQSSKKQEDHKEPCEPIIEFELGGFIPESYISEPALKISLYKQIISIDTMDAYYTLVEEIKDKYGPIVHEMQNFLDSTQLRILCKIYNISQLRERNRAIEFHFQKLSVLPQDKVQQYIHDKKIKIHPTLPHVLLLPCVGLTKDQIFKHIMQFLCNDIL